MNDRTCQECDESYRAADGHECRTPMHIAIKALMAIESGEPWVHEGRSVYDPQWLAHGALVDMGEMEPDEFDNPGLGPWRQVSCEEADRMKKHSDR